MVSIPKYSIIAAVAENFVIGNGLKIPWYIPEDFKLFKEKTLDSVVIMGKKTWDSLPIKPLPNRINIVISDINFQLPESVLLAKSPEDALVKSSKFGKEIFVIGGASIYKQTISNANYLYISHVKGEYEGDILFPKFNQSDYDIIEEVDYEKFTFRKYKKKL